MRRSNDDCDRDCQSGRLSAMIHVEQLYCRRAEEVEEEKAREAQRWRTACYPAPRHYIAARLLKHMHYFINFNNSGKSAPTAMLKADPHNLAAPGRGKIL